ncbi:tetratricopeptide repeat protein [Mycolicibacterium fortuitum]|uniref:tetratricopeptide repeat protein n=1 Tax=Mycolicibacterium fortuitum TaxID=1766 RepID=UPI001CDD6C94|nr:tetratricopeptide repeat protein [Mycolicibacterium fortuitum]UBV13409.1 SEL1-like repeat protein [Mycolicibacterium fortuitum]
MASVAYTKLMQTLSDPGSDSQTLFEDARELSAAFVRNEHRTGLLPPDATDAMVLGFDRAGEAGLAESYMELAALYRNGGTWRAPLLTKDDNRAIELYRLAELLRHPEASLQLAQTAYFARRTDLADEVWQRAEMLSSSLPERADVLVFVGYLLNAGFGVPADPVAAVHKFHAAASLGNADAAFELGLMHQAGIGLPRDEDAGLGWFFWAADLGSARAQYNLGPFYGAGTNGLARDAEMSLEWYLKAAEANHAQAAFTAGVMLLVGDGGLTPDPDRAADLLMQADYLLGEGVVQERLAAMGLRRD